MEERWLQEIRAIDWEEFKGPQYYKADEVVRALANLIELKEREKAEDVGNLVLFALGNNHAGTYYPAILQALDFIIQMAEHEANDVRRRCARGILADWHCSFYPELGSYRGCTEEELLAFVRGKTVAYGE